MKVPISVISVIIQGPKYELNEAIYFKTDGFKRYSLHRKDRINSRLFLFTVSFPNRSFSSLIPTKNDYCSFWFCLVWVPCDIGILTYLIYFSPLKILLFWMFTFSCVYSRESPYTLSSESFCHSLTCMDLIAFPVLVQLDVAEPLSSFPTLGMLSAVPSRSPDSF